MVGTIRLLDRMDRNAIIPRYFFATQIGDSTIPDPTGTVLRDADEAWEKAREVVLESLSRAGDQALLMTSCLVITDESGDVVFEYPFAEALAPGSPDDRVLH